MGSDSILPSVFLPILMLFTQKDRVEGGELRWQTIGMVGGIVLLMVAHTVRDKGGDEIIRIISARKATRKECKHYDENREENTR